MYGTRPSGGSAAAPSSAPASGYNASNANVGYPAPSSASGAGYPGPGAASGAGYPGPGAHAGYPPPGAGPAGGGYYPGYESGPYPDYGPGGIMGGGWGGPMGRHGPSNAFVAVRLKGLPFSCHENDIAKFMGIDTVDILIARQGGRPSGEAFVVLSNPHDIERAMSRHKNYMGPRYIEVSEARKQEYYAAVISAFGDRGGRGRSRSRSPTRGGGSAPPSTTTTILKLRGLPFSATVDDVAAFFDDPAQGLTPPLADMITIAVAGDGRPNGMGFVEFESTEQAIAAQQKHRQMIGSRYVEIFPSSAEERARHSTLTFG